MTKPVKALDYKSSVSDMHSFLIENKFDGFPILNPENQVIGLINRYSILIILRHIEKIKSFRIANEGAEGDYGAVNQSTGRDTIQNVSGRRSLDSLTEDSRDDSDSSRIYQGKLSDDKEEESSIQLEWSDFNVDFHSNIPDAASKEFIDIAEQHG